GALIEFSPYHGCIPSALIVQEGLDVDLAEAEPGMPDPARLRVPARGDPQPLLDFLGGEVRLALEHQGDDAGDERRRHARSLDGDVLSGSVTPGGQVRRGRELRAAGERRGDELAGRRHVGLEPAVAGGTAAGERRELAEDEAVAGDPRLRGAA